MQIQEMQLNEDNLHRTNDTTSEKAQRPVDSIGIITEIITSNENPGMEWLTVLCNLNRVGNNLILPE